MTSWYPPPSEDYAYNHAVALSDVRKAIKGDLLTRTYKYNSKGVDSHVIRVEVITGQV